MPPPASKGAMPRGKRWSASGDTVSGQGVTKYVLHGCLFGFQANHLAGSKNQRHDVLGCHVFGMIYICSVIRVACILVLTNKLSKFDSLWHVHDSTIKEKMSM